MNVVVQEHEMELLPQKAMYWQKNKMLLLADLHLGKINHFRKSGYPVPPKANDENTSVLIDLLNRFRPERVMFLGDLFHSHYNEEWEVFGQVKKHFSFCSFELVMGNHDIMSELQYQRHNIRVHDTLTIDGLLLTHEPATEVPAGHYNLAGHIHPGVRLVGGGRQAVVLPCFHFASQQGILPAFGSFTGLYPIRVKKQDQVYAIVEGNVVKVSE